VNIYVISDGEPFIIRIRHGREDWDSSPVME